MHYYHLLMPWLAGISLFLTLLVFALWVYAGLHIKKLCDLPLSEPGARLPSVSLVAPARNEVRNIEQAVRSLLKLDYPDLQITLVNDRSTDSTGSASLACSGGWRCHWCGQPSANLVLVETVNGVERYKGDCCGQRHLGVTE